MTAPVRGVGSLTGPGRYAGALDSPSPARRDDPPPPAAGNGYPDQDPPPLPATPAGPPATPPPARPARRSSTGTASARSRPTGGGLPDDHSVWVGVRTEGLRYGAQLRRFHERGQALAKAIDDAMGLGATRAEVIRNLTARNARTDLTVDELAMMPEVADRLGLDRQP